MLFLYSALSDIGKSRSVQQDDLLTIPQVIHHNHSLTNDKLYDSANYGVFVVADGMGGGQHGEVASGLVVDGIREYIISHKDEIISDQYSVINDAIYYANSKVLDYIESHPEDKSMGSTVILGLIGEDNLHLAWVGDSRCYVQSVHNKIKQLSRDHSYVQTLIDEGKLNPDEAFHHPNKNIITQSMGMAEILPSYEVINLKLAKYLLLCSDGLNGMLEDPEIEAILASNGSVHDINQNLIDAANEQGGEDNITSILISLEPTQTHTVPIQYQSLSYTTSNENKNKGLIITLIFAGLATLGAILYYFSKSQEAVSSTVQMHNSTVDLQPESEPGINENDSSGEISIALNSTAIDSIQINAGNAQSSSIKNVTYYIRLNVFTDRSDADHLLSKLKKENEGRDYQLLHSEKGFFEVCLFGFESKESASLFLDENRAFPNAVILVKNL